MCITGMKGLGSWKERGIEGGNKEKERVLWRYGEL